ncbi:SHOCT domain-containing protein [uncultured Tyzzerella sp.]|uniref:SHOCT domain-containing protein n=1 Tax=uncultured Tyzzerella sp. TaxID=2321398 RepID=UPI0029425BAE|nr:SHOCT domain-containing protein [uncultured Tyzzerella sp.]
MQVFKDLTINLQVAPRVMTQEAMQKDFEYEMAQKLTRSLYEKGIISVDEMHRIQVLNKKKFSPFYAEIID